MKHSSLSKFSNILRFLDTLSPPRPVHAHCDVPCGVYETDSALWAVETCQKLVEKLLALEAPPAGNKQAVLEYQNTVTRAILVKEEYAQICKTQILILWTDYFKPEHLTKRSDLHEKIWKAAKQCSVVKRTVSLEEVAKLRAMAQEIAEIFHATKT
jgi:nickel superoxide dismutase